MITMHKMGYHLPEMPSFSQGESPVNVFRRVVRLIIFLLGLLAGLIIAIVAFVSRQLISPTRQRLWAVPSDAGLDYQEVEFPARDGLRLSGWFLPCGGKGSPPKPAVILVHGWTWNRLGDSGETLLSNISGGLQVDLLRLAYDLHEAEYHVLMFDLRNHGQSASGGPVTFGLQESNDLLGALDFLATRADVDQSHIGVVGFSVGANALLFSLPHTNRIAAGIAVQPASPDLFAGRYARNLLGPLSAPVLALSRIIYQQAGHLPLSAIEPLMAAGGSGEIPILYVQGTGDRWGSVSNVAQMAARSPRSIDPLFVETHHRTGGYRYVVQHPETVTSFFAEEFQPKK